MWSVVALSAVAAFISLGQFQPTEFGYSFLLYAAITLGLASRIVVAIPRTKGHISVSDTFIFLSIFLFGGEAGILLAAADAVISSLKLTRKAITLLFNVAVFILATFSTVWVLRMVFGSLTELNRAGFSSNFAAAICLIGLIQYVVNSGLVAVGVALKTQKPIWQMWRENFLWTSLTYFAGASAAGIIAQLVAVVEIYAFLAAVPIVAVVYFTYTTYLKNVESASIQAEQAQLHVQELSHHIAEQERISRALKESEEYFRNAFDHAAGMAVINPEGKWMQVNDSLCKMLGYTEQELLENGFQTITHPSDLGHDLANLYKLLEDSIPNYQLEKRYYHKDGRIIWVLQSASLIRDADGRPRHVIFQIQDISDRKKAEELIHHAAFHDALTGLPNRTLFSDRLSMAVERAKRSANYKFAVIFIDLDRFKIINDSLGHDMGDKLLIELSRRVEKCLRAVDTIARLGGDEFAILLDGIAHTEDAVVIAERIQTATQKPFHLDGQEFHTSASIGIAYSLLGYDKPEDILRDADTAMYRAKANGKARFEIFDAQMHTRAVEALTLESELRQAVEKGQIIPFYQPIIELKSGKILGFEALMRWRHPERGLIAPNDFIPLAEETGLIGMLGLAMLKQSCCQTYRWQQKFGSDLNISINLSGRQFKQATLIDEIREVLALSRLSPSFLRLEITETVVMENAGMTSEMLKQLKNLNVQLAVDDFGTGYSSLSYLHKFPFDILKIDRSFVTRMGTDKDSLSIVKTITTLAFELDKIVVAEGIETKQQLDILNGFSCHLGQGYYFSKPVPAEAAERLLKEGLNLDSENQTIAGQSPEFLPTVETNYEM